MTILQKLSDRDGFIFEVIKIIINNNANITLGPLQYKLLECGVYVKKPLLEEALKTMIEKKLLTPTQPSAIKKVNAPKIIVP
jgi:hypothetical protein